MTIAWRVRQHCKVIDKHLNPNEEILYMFAGQKNDNSIEPVVSGLLLYAKTNEVVIPYNNQYNMSGNMIGAHSLDLNQNFKEIKKQLDHIVSINFGDIYPL
mgnify:CR=1 FL=1